MCGAARRKEPPFLLAVVVLSLRPPREGGEEKRRDVEPRKPHASAIRMLLFSARSPCRRESPAAVTLLAGPLMLVPSPLAMPAAVGVAYAQAWRGIPLPGQLWTHRTWLFGKCRQTFCRAAPRPPPTCGRPARSELLKVHAGARPRGADARSGAEPDDHLAEAWRTCACGADKKGARAARALVRARHLAVHGVPRAGHLRATTREARTPPARPIPAFTTRRSSALSQTAPLRISLGSFLTSSAISRKIRCARADGGSARTDWDRRAQGSRPKTQKI